MYKYVHRHMRANASMRMYIFNMYVHIYIYTYIYTYVYTYTCTWMNGWFHVITC